MKASGYSWILTFVIMAMPGIASADDYLDALKDEASDLEYLDESRTGNVGHVNKHNSNKEIIKASQSISNFEQYYKNKDAAGASLYLRLNTEDRIRIYRRFKSTLNFDIVKKMTFDLYQRK